MSKLLALLLASCFTFAPLSFAVSDATTFDTDTKLMLHGDGADASTTITDSSSGGKTVTAVGAAQIDTADKVFGSASVLMTTPGSDYLTNADHADFDLGTGDFTIDFRFKSNKDFSDSQYISTFVGPDTNDTFIIVSYNWEHSRFSIVPYPVSINLTASISKNTWYHFAITRNGTNLRVFLDGTQVGSTTTNSTNITSSSAMFIGAQHNNQANLSFSGWIDEFRFIKGTAVWTSNFTPPTAAYSAPVTTGVKTVDGLAYASVKTRNGLGIASVKTHNGLA
jgi:hypothetical protein